MTPEKLREIASKVRLDVYERRPLSYVRYLGSIGSDLLLSSWLSRLMAGETALITALEGYQGKRLNDDLPHLAVLFPDAFGGDAHV